MRILFLDQFAELGGAQRCLLEVLAAVAGRGWQARLALPAEGPLAVEARALGVLVETIPCGPYRSGQKAARDLARFAWQAAAQAAVIRRRAPDLLYVNGPRLLPGAAAARHGTPVLFHCHSRVPGGVQATVARRSLRWAAATVVASCRYVAEALAPGPFHVVYNGVAGPARPPATLRQGCRIGVIGRIAPQKGQADVLRAARLLPGCRFTICGDVLFGDPEAARYLADLRDLARGLPVEFAGWQQDIYGTLASLDLLAVPSGPEEATTRVILEAFAAGVPVVAYASGGIPEIVEHGTTGFLVAERTPEALAAAIHHALADPCRLERIAIAARARWREHYTLERYRRQMLEHIAAVAGPSN